MRIEGCVTSRFTWAKVKRRFARKRMVSTSGTFRPHKRDVGLAYCCAREGNHGEIYGAARPEDWGVILSKKLFNHLADIVERKSKPLLDKSTRCPAGLEQSHKIARGRCNAPRGILAALRDLASRAKRFVRVLNSVDELDAARFPHLSRTSPCVNLLLATASILEDSANACVR